MATQKQLAARRKFAAAVRAGKFRKKSSSRITTTKTTTKRKTRRVVSMARRKRTTRRSGGSGFKLGKPMVRGTIAAAFAGIGASAIADRFIPGNMMAHYGSALAVGGFPGVIATAAKNYLTGMNPFAVLTASPTKINY